MFRDGRRGRRWLIADQGEQEGEERQKRRERMRNHRRDASPQGFHVSKNVEGKEHRGATEGAMLNPLPPSKVMQFAETIQMM